MKAIIYCRVSTTEQANQGFSLEGQEKECREFAVNNEYEIDKVFIDRGESAKTQDRTQLKNLIKYCIGNKKKISALIVWKLDRLTRNVFDYAELTQHFGSLEIPILSATENNEDSSTGKLMRNIISSFAQYENDIKRERTINGMKRAIEDGRWAWRAPIGYRQSRDDSNKPLLVPTDESMFVVEAFELVTSRLYTQVEIVQILKKKGFKRVSKSLLNRILRNEIYAGFIKVPWYPEYIEGRHEPIVSKDIFFSVQLILNGKKPVIAPKVRNHPDFPLRNFIRCPNCDTKLTGGWSTGRKGVKYAYYHCRTKGCSLNVRKADLETGFYKYLKSFQPKQGVLDLFEEIVLDVWRDRQSKRVKQEHRHEQEIKKLREKQDRVDDLMIQGTFDEETYRRKMSEIKSEMMTTRLNLSDAKTEIVDIEGCLTYCKYFLSNLAELWAVSDHNLKQRFQTLIFPEKIYYENKMFRTTATALLFKCLRSENRLKSYLVPPRGFEPLSHG